MNSSLPSLKLDWAPFEAVKYACQNWHYSGSTPAGKLVKVGVWEGGHFVGVITFGRGATLQIGMPYGLKQTEVCELTRIALREHAHPVSRMVSIALRMLKRHCPGLRLVVSYAASEQGHVGGIYQAGNWIYEGARKTYLIRLHGELVHARVISARWGTGSQSLAWLRKNVDPAAEKVADMVRHKYLFPLDPDMKKKVMGRAKPYPKREKQAMAAPQAAQRRGSTDPLAPATSNIEQ